MKKIILLAMGLAIAVSLLGTYSVLSYFQTVPVTEAKTELVQPAARIQTEIPAVPTQISITAAAPTATALPTLAPTIAATLPVQELAATVVATEAIAKSPEQTAEEALFNQFVQSVSGKDAGQVTGVYVAGRFSLPVMQQPAGDASFVSTEDNTTTQYGSANVYGTIGLLAHNYLSGQKFFDLHEGDEVIVIYGNGSQAHYQVTRIEQYQALSPESVNSDFIDLSDPSQAKLSASQVFQHVYTAQNRLVFQTCINANGDPSWGRLFVSAEKVND